MRKVKANLPIRLEGSKNTRDLGGYPTGSMRNTASGQFLRSDNPSKFTPADVKRLYDYGVRLVIDFRSDSETDAAPCPLKGYEDVEYTNPQMLDNVNVQPNKDEETGETKMLLPPTLGDIYIDFLDNKRHVYVKVFRDVLRHMEHCIFFNCTAGKDRAGTFAMLLLKTAGVSDEVAVIDYAASGDNIKEDMDRVLETYRAQGVTMDEDMIRSRPVHMERALEHLNKTYGGIDNWLLECGLSNDEIDKLKSKLLGAY